MNEDLIKYLDGKFSKIDADFINVKEDIGDLKQDMAGLREAVQVLTISIDKLVKAVSDLKTEYAVITNQVSRHEKWFHQIAEKIGIKLEY